jgi:predicted permease
MCPPLNGTCWTSPYRLDSMAGVIDAQLPWTAINQITPGYFQSAGMRLIEGRPFDDRDRLGSVNVAILNETLARRLWPNGGALGKRFDVLYSRGRVLEVVGVVADVKQFSLEQPASAEMFLPAAQMPVNFMTLMVRTAVEPEKVAKSAEAVIRGLDKGQAISRVTPMLERISQLAAQRRFAAVLLALFSALAVLLSAIGVSGIMAYTVAQRTQEFGIRLALGAQRDHMLGLVLKDGFRLAGLGVAAGLAGAWGLARLIESMLYGVQPHDSVSFVTAAVLLAAVALAACLAPAQRAARVDPLRILRHN